MAVPQLLNDIIQVLMDLAPAAALVSVTWNGSDRRPICVTPCRSRFGLSGIAATEYRRKARKSP